MKPTFIVTETPLAAYAWSVCIVHANELHRHLIGFRHKRTADEVRNHLESAYERGRDDMWNVIPNNLRKEKQ